MSLYGNVRRMAIHTPPQSTEMTVGFVGLGHAGWPMSENLLAAGYRVIVRDSDPERERRFAAEHGCDSCGGDSGRLADADVVITMLPNGEVVRDVLLGEQGIARRLRRGTVIVDTSSSDPQRTRELGAELAEMGLTLLDSPVTRPEPGGTNTRRITFMVAGDDAEAIDRVVPLLEAMAERVFRVGGLGCGHAMKTLNNYVACSGLVAGLDAMIAGQRFGLDVETMLDVFNVGTARNFSTAHVLLNESMSRNYGTGFGLALMVKDLGIANGLFDASGFQAPMPAIVRQLLADALAGLDDAEADHAAALEYWERRGDVTLPPLREA
jgi:3-hydroxyisobutyrate dehydrogenase-like beta-hydroxyacid dehydrogenase